MLRFSYRPLAKLGGRYGNRRILLGLPFIFVWAPTLIEAQRPAIVTHVWHANAVKEIPSLDWVGLFEPLAPYPRWWKETAACASIPLPGSRADSVQFYYVNAVDFAPVPTDKPNRMVVGVVYAANEQIFLSVLRARNEITVKHEMLHQILYWWGERNWDNDNRPEFERCGLQTVE
ncbi:MAG: hypothetical protein ABR585_08105 [Gemmatimonadaceae bacterium]